MKKLVLFAAVVAVAWSAGLLRSGGSTGDLDFVHGLAAGLEKARAEGKPAMLFFTADW